MFINCLEFTLLPIYENRKLQLGIRRLFYLFQEQIQAKILCCKTAFPDFDRIFIADLLALDLLDSVVEILFLIGGIEPEKIQNGNSC